VPEIKHKFRSCYLERCAVRCEDNAGPEQTDSSDSITSKKLVTIFQHARMYARVCEYVFVCMDTYMYKRKIREKILFLARKTLPKTA